MGKWQASASMCGLQEVCQWCMHVPRQCCVCVYVVHALRAHRLDELGLGPVYPTRIIVTNDLDLYQYRQGDRAAGYASGGYMSLLAHMYSKPAPLN